MGRQQFREDLIQWVWRNLEFDPSGLMTVCGRKVCIIDPGKQNFGEGPDFSFAHIRIGELDFYGDVELHYHSSEWKSHSHHKQQLFNGVVLHVVLEHNSVHPLRREDGTEVMTAELKPHLSSPLSRLIRKRAGQGLPCAGNITYINQQAFRRQIEIAAAEYFEYKSEELLSGYDSELPLEKAWKRALLLQIWSLLGIPENCDEMRNLAERVFTFDPEEREARFCEMVALEAFKKEEAEYRIMWKQSGMRPASRPETRVRQAALIHYSLHARGLEQYLRNPQAVWEELSAGRSRGELPGKERLQMLRMLAYLPAIHLLGKLLHSHTLQEWARGQWKREPFPLPREISAPFAEAGFSLDQGLRASGLAHQLKRYCLEKNCTSCKVFKSAIRS